MTARHWGRADTPTASSWSAFPSVQASSLFPIADILRFGDLISVAPFGEAARGGDGGLWS